MEQASITSIYVVVRSSTRLYLFFVTVEYGYLFVFVRRKGTELVVSGM